MLVDAKLYEKMKNIEKRYEPLRFKSVAKISAQYAETEKHFRKEPQLNYKPARRGMNWGGNGITAWFVADVAIPKVCKGKPVFLKAGTNGETLLFVDGVPGGVFDNNHPVVRILAKGQAGQRVRLALEAYSGHHIPGTQPDDDNPPPAKGCKVFDGMELLMARPEVWQFYYDLRTLNQMVDILPDGNLRKGKIAKCLEKVFVIVPAKPEEVPEGEWLPAIKEACAVMAPVLALKNSPTTPEFGVVGHSHIDTAWLWTIDETKRKCARTFSSVVNLMDQYPDFTFIQSAPYHAEVIRELYPELFARIKEKADAGQWEPNGAMYVEPDCNIPNGEAFVRQLLVGDMVQKELFGEDSKSNTFWQPDVFGYSAALPQILKLAGVPYFCTTKLTWNDTNRFPYDTFWWRGIDGTRVISHFHNIHEWPDPETFSQQWEQWGRHSDVQDRVLIPFGYGDGGGGPMTEMIEMSHRVEDLEGCPKAKYTTVGKFMDGIAEELGEELPEYWGELYLELHRGTLTSQAEIKRGNRKCEQAFLMAEKLAAYCGENWNERLLPLWKRFLVLQFHDILPGSSIQKVNEQAVASFEEIMKELGAIIDELLVKVAGKGSKTALVNTHSWAYAGEAFVAGAEGGLEGCESQAVCRINGEKGVVSYVELPAEGGKSFAAAPLKAAESPFAVEGNVVTTPFARVTFDQNGVITSFVDTVKGREIAAGGLNRLLVSEDVPKAWDNWDIDRDEKQKRKGVKLISREVAADGCLQLRIRFTYALTEKSTLTQDVVFHAHTPQVDFETRIDWHDRHKLLKTSFDTTILAQNARHEIQYGHVERPTHTNLPTDRARFEVCAHKFSDLSEPDYGVALLNDCRYGISVLGGEMALTLLKSGVRPDPRADEGVHYVTYALLPHASFGVESVVRPSYELNRVPLALVGAGEMDEGSKVTVSGTNVIVESMKAAQDGRGTVIRLYEAGGTHARARVSFAGMKKAWVTDLLEKDGERLNVKDGGVDVELHPFQILTLRVL